MIAFVRGLNLLILFVACISFMNAEPLERTWATTCKNSNCKQPLDLCIQMNCLGKESCSECISYFFPVCADCSEQINSSPIIIDDQPHILCNQNEPLHLTSCSFFCRSRNMISSSCGLTNGVPLCSCSGYQNGTVHTTPSTTTTTTTTTTTKPTTTTTTASTTTTTQSTTQTTPPSFLASPYSNSLYF